jgi:hypothetical protein
MGMGGVHFVPQQDGSIHPILWQGPFPEDIQQRLVTFDNPKGDINNSELELATSVAQHDIMDQEKVPPPPVVQRRISFVCRHSTSATINMCLC